MTDRTHLPPPPVHPSIRSRSSPGPFAHATSTARPPPRRLPERSVPDLTSSQTPESPTIGSFAAESTTSLPSASEKVEEELSEAQLRELYDDEEIERFLHLFSAYVREVRASDVVGRSAPFKSTSDLSSVNLEESLEENSDADDNDESEELEETSPTNVQVQMNASRSLSEAIAFDAIIPLLPPAPPPSPKFTVHRFKLTIQRLYLATVPAYSSFFSRLIRLATWEDKSASLTYCIAYWILWYLNLLLPALMLRILYSLIRRKMLPYPTLAELRKHRKEVDRAKEVSTAFTLQVVSSPTHDVNDVWKILTTYVQSRKAKNAAKKAKDEAASANGQSADSPVSPTETVPVVAVVSPNVSDADIKTVVLDALNRVADIHERLQNIFLWRRPNASLVAAGVLLVLFLVFLLPAKYLAKMVGFVCGFAFWHVVPIVAAIPSSELARIPPPLTAVPTDAEYAMELISQRVARGLEVKPKRREPSLYSVEGTSSEGASLEDSGDRITSSSAIRSSVDWKKWGGRAAAVKQRTGDVKGMFKNGEWKRPSNWSAALVNPLAPQVVANGNTESRVDTYTFPAQCAKASGLITLTSDVLIFTPLLSNSARLSIPMSDMLGVKKTGPMRGLNVRWAKVGGDGQAEEQETSFVWIGARNELFARLIGLGGRRWAKV